MKHRVSILLLGWSIITVTGFVSAETGKEFGKISLPLGKVEVRSNDDGSWERALPNRTVYTGNIIRTDAKSRCEITLKGGGKVRIGAAAELELNDVNIKGLEKTYAANLKSGSAWVSAKAAFGEKKNVSLKMPTAVAAIRGTTYRTIAGEEESSVLVYDGKVAVNQPAGDEPEAKPEEKQDGSPGFKLGPVEEIEAPTEVAGPYEVTLEEWITLAEGMQINVRADGKYHMFEFDREKDQGLEFVRWNQERDAADE